MAAAEEKEKPATRARLDAITVPVSSQLRSAGLLSVVAALLWYVQAALVADVFSALAAERPGLVPSWIAISAFLLLGAVRALTGWRAGQLGFEAAQGAMAAEREKLIARESLRSPLSGAGASAEVASLAAEKIAALGPYITRYRPAMLRTRILPVVIVAIAFSISWVAGMILLVTGPLIPVFMILVGLAAREASERQMQEVGTLNTLLTERLRAMTDIRLLDASQRTVEGLAQGAEALRAKTMAVLRIAFLSSTVLELFSAIGVALMAVYVGFALLGEISFGAYGTPLTLFEGIFLLLLAPEFYQPIRDLAAAWHDKAAAQAVAGELAAAEAAPARTIAGTGGTSAQLAQPGRLITRGLRYRTPAGGELHFPDLGIAIGGKGPGEKIAIVGDSGAGKSTLLALLAGLARPSAGAVEIAGRPLDDDTADAWRAGIAWIGQTPHFLNASLRANLLQGVQEEDAADLDHALELAAAGGIVSRLPRGLLTRIGETGHGVSGGEARRLTIAAAIAAKPKLVLADEPTADLDEETAELVTAGLIEMAEGGAAVIVATHDMALAEKMDRRIVIGDVR